MDDRYTSQAPDWNTWVSGGDLHPPEEPVDPLAVLAEKRRLAQEALLSAQPNASAPEPVAAAIPPPPEWVEGHQRLRNAAPFNGLQEGQVVQPPPAGWRPPPTDMPVPPVPPDVVPPDPKANSPVAAALGGPTQAPTAAPPPTPGAPVAEALAAPPGAPTALPPPTLTPVTAPTPPGAPAAGPRAPASPDRLAAFSAPYQKGQGYYDLVHAGEGNGVNPITGAAGPVQVIPATANAFHASPGNADVNLNTPEGAKRFTQWYGDQNSSLIQSITGRPATNGEVAAAHLVGPGGIKALLTNPNAPIGQTLGMAAVKNNPGPLPDPNMTGTQALASIQNYYAGAKGGGDVTTASSTSTPLAPPSDVRPGAGSRQAQMDAILGGKMPYSYADIHGGPGDGLLAFAGGLLSGKSPSDAFGKGFTALAAHGQTDRANMMKANALQVQLASLGIRGQTAAGNLDHKTVTEGQGDRRLGQGDDRIKIAEEASRRSQEKLDDVLSGAAAGRTAGAAEAQAAFKGNLKDQQGLNTQANAARETLRTLDQYSLDGVAAGPDMVSRGKRALSQVLGIDLGTNPTQLQITEAMDNSLQRGTLQNLGIGRILQAELPMLKGQIGGLAANNPEAIKSIHDMIRNAAQSRVTAEQQFGALDPEERTRLMTTPGGVNLWTQNAMSQAHEAGLKAPPKGASGPSAAPQGAVKMTGPKGTFMVPPDKVDLFKQNGYQ